MSTRYKGSIMSSTAATNTALVAAGIWKQTDVAQLINTGWPSPFTDPYWSSVSMLLHGDGANGAQNNTFTDSSSSALSLTRGGSATQGSVNAFGSAAPYTVANVAGSGYFNGSTDYITIPANTGINLGTGDFTIECWVYPLALPTQSCYVDFWTNTSGYIVGQCQLTSLASGAVQFNFTTSTSTLTTIQTAGSLVALNTWTHLAVVRSGTATGNIKIYVNGVVGASSATGVTQNIGTTGIGKIGAQASNNTSLTNGYIASARVVKGTAVYTAPFTPPTAPLTAISGTTLLTNFTDAGIYDNAMLNDLVTVGTAQISTAVFKYGTGSLAFSGSGAWLTAADRTSLQLGTGSFTIEGWVYVNALGVAYGIVSKGAASTGWSVNITSGNKLQFSYTASVLTGATSLTASTWYYFAVVRSGSGTGNVVLYLNGTADATSAGAVTDNFTQTSILYVGADRVGGSPLNGYIDDLRITKGVARYTANFTPPGDAFPNKG